MNVSGSSRPGIPAEMDRQTIQDLHMAIERGTLLRKCGSGKSFVLIRLSCQIELDELQEVVPPGLW
jgi:hypothetical protein